MPEILLFSAGLDSFPAWHYLGRPPALYFDIRHHFREQELAAVKDLAGRCQMDLTISRELDLSAWDTPQGDLIPFRNVLLAMLAALRADVIWCAGVKGDHTADKSPEAFARMSEMLTGFAGRPVRGDSPLPSPERTRGSGLIVIIYAKRMPHLRQCLRDKPTRTLSRGSRFLRAPLRQLRNHGPAHAARRIEKLKRGQMFQRYFPIISLQLDETERL